MANVTSTITTNAANLVKFFAGGSGDNIIADGYIRTVEKIWIDSHTIAFTNTLTAIAIAEIPENKKITRIDVVIDTSASQTSGTVSVGYILDAANVLLTTGVANFLAPVDINHNLTRTTISLPSPGLIQAYTSLTITNATQTTIYPAVLAGFQHVTAGTQVTIGIKLNNWTMTTGTIKTVVCYT